MSTKLFSFDTPPVREAFRVTIKSTLIAEITEMTDFAKESMGNPSIDASQMIEFILEEAYFSKKHRKEIKAFREWQKERDGAAGETSKKPKKAKKEKQREESTALDFVNKALDDSEVLDKDFEDIINEEFETFDDIEFNEPKEQPTVEDGGALGIKRIINR